MARSSFETLYDVADCAVVRMVRVGKDHGSGSVAVFVARSMCAWSPCPVRAPSWKRTSPDWSTVDHSPVLENFAVSSRDAVACSGVPELACDFDAAGARKLPQLILPSN